MPAPKLADGSGLEAHLQLVRDRELRDLFVAEPADGAKLLGVEGVDGFLDLATEDALLLAAMQPVAEPHETGHAAAELLDELATQAGFRFFGAFEAASRQAGFGESRRIPAKASMQRAYLR